MDFWIFMGQIFFYLFHKIFIIGLKVLANGEIFTLKKKIFKYKAKTNL